MQETQAAEGTAFDWHGLEVDEVVRLVAADTAAGLSSHEAERRLRRFGMNQLPAPGRQPTWKRLLRQFHNVLIYLMLFAAVVTAALAHWLDAGVLLTAVLVNAAIGFIQEGKAENALDAIRRMLSLRASVWRDGRRVQLPAEQLVPGDVVVLGSGDKVPADLRLTAARGVHADEAMLTGESVPVAKAAHAVPAGASLGDRRNMLYSGTLVASGSATGVVVATGTATEIGRISTMLERIDESATPLLRQIAHFSRWLGFAIVVAGVLTFAFGVLVRERAATEMFIMVVALAASAIPEGLPAIMTITLALGVRRMAERQAIVRKLPAVETLGSVTVICSDKTGTLTRNEMTTQRVVSAADTFELSGAGYAPDGAFHLDGAVVALHSYPELVEIARAASLCNDAMLRCVDGAWQLDGDPTEGALQALAMKAGVDPDSARAHWPRIDAIPFESQHRFMATLHRTPDEDAWVYVKGAPERVLDICGWQRTRQGTQPLDPDYWRRAATDCAARAMRVLAIAARRMPAGQRSVEFADVDSDFTMLALFGTIDPPRDEARAAVAECQSAGIRVKMITGDHPETARAIGAQVGIGAGKPALTGAEIELMDDAQLRRVVSDIDVFARASPEHKLRLVSALQANGSISAMTGDGVNDAPALKRADVGVAMGLKGTEAAKEAADVVLADDDFATIANAVREGRGIYDNIRKFILFMLPTNGGEALVVLAAILFGLVLPLTPPQVLWINMATSSTLGIALAFEPAEGDVMRRAPRAPNEALLTPFFVWRVVMVSFAMMTGALGLFLWEMHAGASVETARTMAVNAVVVSEMFYLINSRHFFGPALSREGLFGNRHALVAIAACLLLQLAFTHAAPLQRVFGSTDLGPQEWLRVVGAGLFVFVVAEVEKAVLRRYRSRRGSDGSPGSTSRRSDAFGPDARRPV